MLYSYRHPDLAASVVASALLPKLSHHEIAGLVERRKVVRPIPAAAVVHGNDADAWSLWDQAVEGEGANTRTVTKI
jgi:hypothetical protein